MSNAVTDSEHAQRRGSGVAHTLAVCVFALPQIATFLLTVLLSLFIASSGAFRFG